MDRDGILTSRAGKVTLLRPRDLPEGYDVLADDHIGAWEVLHHLDRRSSSATASRPPARSSRSAQERPDGAVDAELVKELAFLLFSIAEKNGWTKDALSFNTVRHQLAGHRRRRRAPNVGPTGCPGRIRLRRGVSAMGFQTPMYELAEYLKWTTLGQDPAAGLPARLQVGGRAHPAAARHGPAGAPAWGRHAAQDRQRPGPVQARPIEGVDAPDRH